MNLDFFFNLFDAYLICLFFILIIYFVLNTRVMLKVTGVILFVELFSRLISKNLLNLPFAEYIWYLSWATIALLLLYQLVKETRKSPHIQKVTMPICFLILMVIVIEILRYFERNFSDLEVLKSIYGIGSLATNWLIIAYLFAPIGLHLLKSLRSRVSAKH